MKKLIFINILFSLIYEFVYAISGIIVPKLLLNTFGSEVNGLVSSLTSFLAVFTLIEGGMKAVVGAKLYKPLVENDNESFNKVVATANDFYKKLAIYYVLFAVGLGIIYPLIKHTSFSFSYIFVLAIILSLRSFVSYYTHITSSTIIYADNKSYITHISLTIAAILNIIFVVVGTNMFPNIHFVKFLTFLAFLVNPLFTRRYVNKHYKINKDTKVDYSVLDQRWDGFADRLSRYIMGNVDIYVLTFFSSLINVSIYSVYSIIVSSIRQLVNSISTILVPFLGKAKASKSNMSNVFYIQLYITGITTVVFFSCAYVLLDPFIRIYTSNITDANYISPTFGFLFVTSGLIACLNFPFINIVYATGDFKNAKYLSITEAIINVLLSVLLVFNYGLNGVMVATLIARTIRIVMQLMYLYKNEKDINIFKSIVKIIEKIIMVFIITFVLNNIITFNTYSYLTWFANGFLAFIVSCVLCMLLLFIFDNKITTELIKDLIKHAFKQS